MEFRLRPRLIPLTLLVVASGCGGAGDTTDQVSAPPGDSCAAPPRPTDTAIKPNQVAFVVDSWDFGEPGSPQEANAPRYLGIGRDIDGRSTPSCATRFGAAARAQYSDAPGQFVNVDGACGIDNAFVAMATASRSQPSKVQTERAVSGVGTLLIVLDDLGEGPSQGHIGGAVMHAAPHPQPSFVSSEIWSPTAESFLSGKPRAAIDGYLSAGLVVVSSPFAIEVRDEYDISLPIVNARVSARLSADRGQLDGTLSGTISWPEPHYVGPPCEWNHDLSAPAADLFGDVLLSREVDTTKYCDGISFGVRFTAKRITLGEPAAPVAPPPAPCAK